MCFEHKWRFDLIKVAYLTQGYKKLLASSAVGGTLCGTVSLSVRRVSGTDESRIPTSR